VEGDKLIVGRDGTKHKETWYFYGFKDRVSLDSQARLVTNVKPGYANEYDSHQLKELIYKKPEKGIRIGTVAMDKARESLEFQEGQRGRYKIMRKFDEVKKWHNLAKCRYIGFVRCVIQFYLTFMVVDLKRLVKLLTGVSGGGEARAMSKWPDRGKVYQKTAKVERDACRDS